MTNSSEKKISKASISMTRREAAAILSGVEVALSVSGGEPPKEVARPLAMAVQKISDAFEFVL